MLEKIVIIIRTIHVYKIHEKLLCAVIKISDKRSPSSVALLQDRHLVHSGLTFFCVIQRLNPKTPNSM